MPTASHLDLARALEELNHTHRATGAWIAGEASCSRSGLGVVRLLEHRGPLLVGDVATALRVDISVASRQVTALVDAGIVARSVADDDRRARTVGLTPAGLEVAAGVHVAAGALMAEILADWTEAEIVDSASHFRRLTAAINAYHDRRCTDVPSHLPDPKPAHDDREHV